MSIQSNFYQTRAEEERTKAEGSTLANVRDGHLRAAAAWQAMADKLERAETARAEREEAVAKLRAAAAS